MAPSVTKSPEAQGYVTCLYAHPRGTEDPQYIFDELHLIEHAFYPLSNKGLEDSMLYFKAIFLMPKQCFFTYFDIFHSLRQEEIYQVTKCPVFPLRNDGTARAGRGWEGLSARTFHVQPCPSLDLRPISTREATDERQELPPFQTALQIQLHRRKTDFWLE